jgi:predicted metalloprotease with PDZ domain
MDAFPLDVASEAGYRVGYGKTPSGLQEYYDRDSVNARDSLGLTFSNDGQITGVVLDGLGDKKGLHQDVKVIGVNGKKFSRHWLTKALEESLQTKRVELLIERGDDLITVLLPYGDGPRFIQLVRDEKKPDLLGEIVKPRVEVKKEKK